MHQSAEVSLRELKKIFQQLDPSERATMLNAVDPKGNTLLHTAVDADDFERVSYLLGHDVRMNTKNAEGDMPLDIARKKDNKRIATLLTTRMDWMDRNSSGISLNRALELIQDSYHSIEKGRDKDLVLILGETGVGKSTLINYLNGVEYKEVGTRGFDCRTECVGGTEIASVGHSTAVSETLYPQVLKISSDRGVLDVADLAGLNGTRESVVELAGTLSTHLLAKMTKAIKSILFVIDVNSLSASRGGPFRQTIKTLNKILQGNFTSKASASVHFVITKLPPGVTTKQLISRFIQPLHEQLERLISQDGLSEDDQAMYHTVELMLQFPERIFTPNVFDKGGAGSSREQILAALNGSPLISKDGLDFLHMDRHQEAFLMLLTFLSGEYTRRAERIQDVLPNRIKQLQTSIDSDTQLIKLWEGEMTEIRKTQEEGLTPQKALHMIHEKQTVLRELEETHRQKTQEHITLKMRIETDAQLLQELDVDTPMEYGQAFRFQHAAEIVITKGRDPGVIKSLLGAKSKPPEVKKKPGTGEHVFSYTNAPGKVVDLECYTQQGNFTQRQLQHNGFVQKFNYPLGENTYAEVRMKIAKRDIPATKVRIDQAKERTAQHTQRLAELDTELKLSVSQQDIIRDEVHQLQGDGIDAAATMESLKTQIQQREEWIKNKQECIAGAKREITTCEDDRAQLNLELDVNHDVFETLYQISKTLELDKSLEDDVIKNFFGRYGASADKPEVETMHSPGFFKKVFAANQPSVNAYRGSQHVL